MAFQQTSSSDWRDLLSIIKSFATGQGWTVVYDSISSKGQLGIEKGSCHLAIGSTRNSADTADANLFNRNDLINGGTVPDAMIVGALGSSLTAGNTHYWGHPGSIVTTFNDIDAVDINDLVGPFANVWLYSDSTGSYIHVVVQSGADKYTHFSFGNIDKKGKSHPDVGFFVGCNYIFWPNSSSISSGYAPNDFSSGLHICGTFFEGGSAQIFLPDDVVDSTYGFTNGAFATNSFLKVLTRGNNISYHEANASGWILDYTLAYANEPVTGGVPLSPIPCIYTQGGLHSYLGELPDVRLCNIDNLNPGQEIVFGSDVWQVFPYKRKGSQNNTFDGVDPLQYLNTNVVGLAYKKTL
jgi:hypothetical protein